MKIHPKIHSRRTTISRVLSCVLPLVFCLLLLLASSPSRAAVTSFTHNFQGATPTVSYSNNNTVGTIGGEFVYTCANGAVFQIVNISGYNYVLLSLVDGDSQVVTTEVSDLKSVDITYYPTNKGGDITIEISSDNGTNWTSLTPTGSAGNLSATMPNRGDYKVRISNTTNSIVSLCSITYYTEHCNCFMVVPE